MAVQAWHRLCAMTMPAVFPDVSRSIRDELDDAALGGASWSWCAGNKDRPDSRLVFAGKTAAYLQRGVGLIIVVHCHRSTLQPPRRVDRVLGLDSSFSMPRDSPLYAVAYRPIRRGQNDQIDALAGVFVLESRCLFCSCLAGPTPFRSI